MITQSGSHRVCSPAGFSVAVLPSAEVNFLLAEILWMVRLFSRDPAEVGESPMGYPLLCALGQAGHLSELRFPELESS